jgi:hypothetical protein
MKDKGAKLRNKRENLLKFLKGIQEVLKYLQFKLSVAFCSSLRAYLSASTAVSPFMLMIAAIA